MRNKKYIYKRGPLPGHKNNNCIAAGVHEGNEHQNSRNGILEMKYLANS